MSVQKLRDLLPEIQIDFYYRYKNVQDLSLDETLAETVKNLDIVQLDIEIARLVPKAQLQKLASLGLRAELFFALPTVIRSCPYLYAYYRLLLGFSQKSLTGKDGYSRFQYLEKFGKITPGTDKFIEELCERFGHAACLLLDAIELPSIRLIRDLQMLTLGAQLRGSLNTRIGDDGVRSIRDYLVGVLKTYLVSADDRSLIVRNDSNRVVVFQFSEDPDIEVFIKGEDDIIRRIAIEVKAGADVSNIHNRLGEAEKSHTKAQRLGYNERWTMIKVQMDPKKAAERSPTTTAFFNLSDALDHRTSDGKKFASLLEANLGINLYRNH